MEIAEAVKEAVLPEEPVETKQEKPEEKKAKKGKTSKRRSSLFSEDGAPECEREI